MPLPSLLESIANTVPEAWFSSEFKSVIEDHLVRLRTNNSVAFPITTDEGFLHKGDFYSLLTSRNIPTKFHWIIMRVNNQTTPYKYNGEDFDLIIPDEDYIENIYDNFKSSYG